MNEFKCKICKENHKLVTLIEFPQPEIISEITSGKRKGTLDLMGKNCFIVDKEKIFILCELVIDIVDYEDDELELLVWVEIKGEVFAKIKNLKEIDELKLLGTLSHSIPFYENSDRLPVEIHIDLNGRYFDSPKILDLKIDHKLKEDIDKGIELDAFLIFLSKLHHVPN